eukprot:TRINITY_DN18285_c0_g3_i1.p1 TRINITY_DN18285_c0_g3~~TRINITY_DN18285_c0_g3_i1.p1  ORF type:complete len:764 (+),score=249.05 TRINITY_DN18285_c0_g3_i1:105-2294(+)
MTDLGHRGPETLPPAMQANGNCVGHGVPAAAHSPAAVPAHRDPSLPVEPEGTRSRKSSIESIAFSSASRADSEFLRNDNNQALMEQSWEAVRQVGLDQLGFRHYKLLVEYGGDDVKTMFQHTHLDRQQKMLISTMKWMVNLQKKNLRNSEGLKRLAIYHAHLGVTPTLLSIFGRAFVQAMKLTIGEEFTEEMQRVWECTYAVICDVFLVYVKDLRDQQQVSPLRSDREEERKSAYMNLRSYFHDTGEENDFLANSDKEGSLYVSHYPPDSVPSDEVPHVNTAFRRRWVVLRGRYLYIQRKEQTAPNAVIDLGYSTLSDTSKPGELPSPSPFSFALIDNTNYPTYFLCSGDDDKETWYEKLIQQLNRFAYLKETFPRASGGHLQIRILGEKLEPVSLREDDFEMLTLVGRGSFGHVYKVRQKQSGKIYAVKVIKKSSLRVETRFENLRCEKTILRNISHPFIVKLHAAFQGKDSLYLLFTFLSGGELFFHMQKSNSHFSEEKSRFYIAESALAVSYLHSQKIIHRDLKAENLVLDSEGHVNLTDFGFAKVLDPEEGLPHHTCGTLAYMAPEIFVKSTLGYGQEVDWWSLGVLLFNMLTGRYPFLCKTPQDTLTAITSQPLVYPDTPVLSEHAVSLVNKLLKKKPQNRLSNIETLKAHPWFAGFDWEKCHRREMTPPFIPDTSGRNTKYFQPCERGASLASLSSVGLDKTFSSFFDLRDTYFHVESEAKTE